MSKKQIKKQKSTSQLQDLKQEILENNTQFLQDINKINILTQKNYVDENWFLEKIESLKQPLQNNIQNSYQILTELNQQLQTVLKQTNLKEDNFREKSDLQKEQTQLLIQKSQIFYKDQMIVVWKSLYHQCKDFLQQNFEQIIQVKQQIQDFYQQYKDKFTQNQINISELLQKIKQKENDDLLIEIIEAQEILNKRVSDCKIALDKKLSQSNMDQLKKIVGKFKSLHQNFKDEDMIQLQQQSFKLQTAEYNLIEILKQQKQDLIENFQTIQKDIKLWKTQIKQTKDTIVLEEKQNYILDLENKNKQNEKIILMQKKIIKDKIDQQNIENILMQFINTILFENQDLKEDIKKQQNFYLQKKIEFLRKFDHFFKNFEKLEQLFNRNNQKNIINLIQMLFQNFLQKYTLKKKDQDWQDYCKSKFIQMEQNFLKLNQVLDKLNLNFLRTDKNQIQNLLLQDTETLNKLEIFNTKNLSNLECQFVEIKNLNVFDQLVQKIQQDFKDDQQTYNKNQVLELEKQLIQKDKYINDLQKIMNDQNIKMKESQNQNIKNIQETLIIIQEKLMELSKQIQQNVENPFENFDKHQKSLIQIEKNLSEIKNLCQQFFETFEQNLVEIQQNNQNIKQQLEKIQFRDILYKLNYIKDNISN